MHFIKCNKILSYYNNSYNKLTTKKEQEVR